MFGSSQNIRYRKPLKDALSVYVYVFICECICLQARCAKTEPSSYGLCETKNQEFGSCILTTKHVTMTNYYNISSGGRWIKRFGSILKIKSPYQVKLVLIPETHVSFFLFIISQCFLPFYAFSFFLTLLSYICPNLWYTQYFWADNWSRLVYAFPSFPFEQLVRRQINWQALTFSNNRIISQTKRMKRF